MKYRVKMNFTVQCTVELEADSEAKARRMGPTPCFVNACEKLALDFEDKALRDATLYEGSLDWTMTVKAEEVEES